MGCLLGLLIAWVIIAGAITQWIAGENAPDWLYYTVLVGLLVPVWMWWRWSTSPARWERQRQRRKEEYDRQTQDIIDIVERDRRRQQEERQHEE